MSCIANITRGGEILTRPWIKFQTSFARPEHKFQPNGIRVSTPNKIVSYMHIK